MKSNLKKIILINILIFSIFSLNAENNPKPYGDDEFSQTSKDIRRFEIITLGSMPFITFDTILIYSGIQWGKSGFEGTMPNPFTAKNYLTNEEMTGIILTSMGISLTIALVDFIINRVKRNKIEAQNQKNILILPEELNPQGTQINNEQLLHQEEN